MGVRYEVEDGIAKITLDRAAAGNSIDLDTATLLHDIIERAANDYSRAVLVSGAGGVFCSGVDLAAMSGAEDRASYHLELSSTLDGGFRLLGSMSKPAVAAVGGGTSGAGLALALSCDIVVASRSARFSMGYAGDGLTPDGGVSWLLPRAVGQQRALELALTDRSLTADNAVDWGLATMAVEDMELATRSTQVAAGMASEHWWAYGHARRLIRRSWEASRDESGGDEAVTIARAAIMPDAKTATRRTAPR